MSWKFAAAFAIGLATGLPAPAAELGSEDEAKSMLAAAVDAVETDKSTALEAFNAGSPAFRKADLYVFCANESDGIVVAHGGRPENVGDHLGELKDVNGKAFGAEMLEVATAGEFRTVDYEYPRPGEQEPSPKSTFVTVVDGLLCGVGYYK